MLYFSFLVFLCHLFRKITQMKNIGSITSIKIHEIKKNQFDLCPNIEGLVSLEDIEITQTTNLVFTPETAECHIKEKPSEHNSFWSIDLECMNPKLDFKPSMDKLWINHYIIEIMDGNGTPYLIGNSSSPVLIVQSKSIPKKTAGYNGRKITFHSSQTHDILHLDISSSGGNTSPK